MKKLLLIIVLLLTACEDNVFEIQRDLACKDHGGIFTGFWGGNNFIYDKGKKVHKVQCNDGTYQEYLNIVLPKELWPNQ